MIDISIVMPVRNGAETLADQLRALDLAVGDRDDVEIVIADNGSTDATPIIADEWRQRLPIRRIDASRCPGINVARNDGIRSALGRSILLCDADDEVDRSWIDAMSAAFRDGAELVAGPIDYGRLNDRAVRRWRGAERSGVIEMLDFLPSGHGANMGFTRRVFEDVGGFDEGFRGGGDDVDFFWRAQLAGFELHPVEDAVVHYRLRPSRRASWRQTMGYGASEAVLYGKFRDRGLRRRPVRQVAGEVAWLVSRLPGAVLPHRRDAWLRRLATLVGRLRGSIAARTLWW